MRKLGTLQRVDPRSVWANEASDFTPWLVENLELLGETLGLDLELVRTEAEVGAFSLDIEARDVATGHTVVIENQLEATDHSHLGQLLTYASGMDASVVVWIARDFRDEHRQALDWLNSHETEIQYFGIAVEVLQIDSSAPAVHFRVVSSPNDWSRSAKKQSSSAAPSEKMERYRQFFQALIDELRDTHAFTNAKVAQPQNWYSFSTGVSGFGYGFSFAKEGEVRADLYIDTKDGDRNERILEHLRASAAEIEKVFPGQVLHWEPLENRRSCRVGLYTKGAIDASNDALEDTRRWAVTSLLRLKEAFGPRLMAASKVL